MYFSFHATILVNKDVGPPIFKIFGNTYMHYSTHNGRPTGKHFNFVYDSGGFYNVFLIL